MRRISMYTALMRIATTLHAQNLSLRGSRSPPTICALILDRPLNYGNEVDEL